MNLIIILLIIYTAVSVESVNSRVKITNNGYTDIVVAFHNEIKEAEGFPLIQKIKELFSSASHALYRATRQRSYFKQVTILVPKTWSKKPEYQVASDEIFSQADVKIVDENPFYGDVPYTSQPTPCGQPARFIHLTPRYLKYLDRNSTEMFGDPGKTLVREWAHYRYGIFNEYSEELYREEFPLFYIDEETENALPNACTNSRLTGEKWDPIKKQFCLRQKNGLPNFDCIFLPDPNRNNKITSSIASFHFLPNAYTFCDDSHEFKHNKQAPNRHNRLCNSRSTWNVITSHKDFSKNNNPQRNIDNTTPIFKIVQQEEATFCLVLDISGSMDAPHPYTKITMLNEAASRWLSEEVKFGSNVGIVLFGNGAYLEHRIVRVTGNAIKQQLISKLPSVANSGETCIGCGLKIAVEELKRFRGGVPGGIIVLLSDGEENQSPLIKDVQQELIDAKIRVITMAFTAAASSNMEALAIVTDGKQFSIPLDQSVGKLETSFLEIGTYQSTDDDLSAKIIDERFKGTTDDYVGSFLIDATIGRETTISFLYTERSDITDIIITGKSWFGSINLPGNGGKVEDLVRLKQVKFTCKDLPIGKYTYKVIRRGSINQDITTTVLSKSRSKGAEAIRTTCQIAQIENKNPPEYLITVEVSKGMKPVINAKVISKVDLPNGKSIYIELFDTGKKGDIIRNDGIYSGYFTQYIGKGRYSVSASVVSTTETAWFETGFVASNALPVLNKKPIPSNGIEVSSGDFQRIAEAGSIQIEEDLNAQMSDLFPPARITDLSVKKIADDNSYVIFEWTAPGDDLQNGQAEEYQMKYTMDWNMLNENFFGEEYNITTQPKMAGESETLKANLTGLGNEVTYQVALKTKDDSGKWSEISNIAEVRGRKI